MTELSPPIDYTAWRTKGSAQINAFNSPLTYTSTTKTLGISEATEISRGIVGVSDQSFKGNKTFVDNVKCFNLPTASEDLVNKGYVDQLVSAGLQWKKAVIAFHDFSSGVPNPLNVGDRYIALTTYQSFDINYIYEWNGTTWIENIVSEGCCVYVSGDTSPMFPNMCVFFNGSSWTNFSAAISHDTLIGVHQNVNTTATPTFSSLTTTGNINGRMFVAENLYVQSNQKSTFYNDDGSRYLQFDMYASSADMIKSNVDIKMIAQNSVIIDNATQSTSSSTGALLVNGGVGIGNSLHVGGSAKIMSASQSSSTSTGALTVNGGCGIAGNLNVGTSITLRNILAIDNNTGVRIGYMSGMDDIFSINSDGNINLNAGTSCIINKTTQSSSTSTGALLVNGGCGITGNLNVGGTLTTNSNLTVGGDTVFLDNWYKKIPFKGGNSTAYIQTDYAKFGDGINIMYNQHSDGTDVVCDNNASTSRLHLGYGTISLMAGYNNTVATPTARVNHQTLFVDRTYDAFSIGTGALIVAGGVSVAKRVYATNMTCLSTPVSNTDVVRKQDINFYGSEQQLTITWTGMWNNNQSSTAYLQKIGNIVHLSINGAVWSENIVSPAHPYSTTNVIPVGYRPTTTISDEIMGYYNSAFNNFLIQITTEGIMHMYKDYPNSNNFTTNNVGLWIPHNVTITWRAA